MGACRQVARRTEENVQPTAPQLTATSTEGVFMPSGLLLDCRLLPANPLNHTLKTAGAKRYFLSVGFFSSAGGALLPVDLGKSTQERRPDVLGFLSFQFPFRRTRSKPIRRALRPIHLVTIHGLC
jgi:hypothetical protein